MQQKRNAACLLTAMLEALLRAYATSIDGGDLGKRFKVHPCVGPADTGIQRHLAAGGRDPKRASINLGSGMVSRGPSGERGIRTHEDASTPNGFQEHRWFTVTSAAAWAGRLTTAGTAPGGVGTGRYG